MLGQSNIWIEEASTVFLFFQSQMEIRIRMSVTYFVFTLLKIREGFEEQE